MVKISSKAKQLITLLNQSGYEAYLVGGCVRDLIMGEEPHDWDICTQAKPDEIIKVLKHNKIKFNTVGIEFGTVVAMMDNSEFEITTFRKETGYSDGRHPDKVEYADAIEEDLARRDFTINAIAMTTDCKDCESGIKLIDPYGGVSDIQNKRLRCVGNAVDRFNEDSLRILRALRFSIKYDL